MGGAPYLPRGAQARRAQLPMLAPVVGDFPLDIPEVGGKQTNTTSKIACNTSRIYISTLRTFISTLKGANSGVTACLTLLV